jgi:hypothetical protein
MESQKRDHILVKAKTTCQWCQTEVAQFLFCNHGEYQIHTCMECADCCALCGSYMTCPSDECSNKCMGCSVVICAKCNVWDQKLKTCVWCKKSWCENCAQKCVKCGYVPCMNCNKGAICPCDGQYYCSGNVNGHFSEMCTFNCTECTKRYCMKCMITCDNEIVPSHYGCPKYCKYCVAKQNSPLKGCIICRKRICRKCMTTCPECNDVHCKKCIPEKDCCKGRCVSCLQKKDLLLDGKECESCRMIMCGDCSKNMCPECDGYHCGKCRCNFARWYAKHLDPNEP